MITLNFLLTTLVVVLIPGTGVLFTVSTALQRGGRAGVVAALGCTAGIVPHLLASVCGLAALLHASAVAFQSLKIVGVAYLFYLAVMTWREKGGLAVQPAAAPDRRWFGLVTRGFLLNILNPKLSLFFVAFLPQFIPAHAADPLRWMLGLSGVFMLLTFAGFVLYAALANRFRRSVLESPRVQGWLRRGFAASFAGLGLNLALGER